MEKQLRKEIELLKLQLEHINKEKKLVEEKLVQAEIAASAGSHGQESENFCEKKLGYIIKRLPMPMCLVKDDGRIDYVNDYFTKFFGYRLEDVPTLNDWWVKAYPDEDYRNWVIGNWLGSVEIASKTDSDIHPEIFKVTCSDGSQKQVLISGISVLNSFLISFADISNELYTIEAMQKNDFKSGSVQEYYEQALLAAIDLTGSEKGFFYLHNSDTGEYRLNNWYSIYAGSNHGMFESFYEPGLNPIWDETLRTKMPQIVNDFLSIDWRFPDKEKIKRMLVVPLFEKGAVGALIGVAGKGRDYDQQDVHHLSLLLKGIWKKVEQKRFEMELIQAKNRAEESDKLKSAFLATMSHELRTPLNAIIGFSDLLMDEDNKDFMVEFSNTINQSGKHLLEIIEEVFLISELESIEIKLKSNLFEAEKLLLKAHKECIEFATSSNKGHIEIEVDADPQLKQVLVKADFERLTQLYGQLVRNAVKFTQKGKITIGLGFQNNTPVFFVSDTGIGIESKHLSKVTERFYQIEQTLSREYSGIGLGLTIAKKIIELYNGKIWIDSEPGKGTTVYFTFPAFIINVLQPLGEKEFD